MKELGGLLLVGLLLAGSVEGQVRRGQAGAGTLSDEEAAYWGQVAAYSEETARWVNQDPLALDDPEGVFHEAVAVSPNGMNVVGTALVPGVGTVASVWLSRERGRLRYLEDEGGKPLIGAGVGVTDDGLVLVASSDGDSRLWHPSFGGAATRRLADVLAAYGQTLPADVTAPHSLIAFGRTYHIAVSSKTLGALHITLPNPLPGPGAQGLGIGSGVGTPGSVTPFGPIRPFPTINGGRDFVQLPNYTSVITHLHQCAGGPSLDGQSKIFYRSDGGSSHIMHLYDHGTFTTASLPPYLVVEARPVISNSGNFAVFATPAGGGPDNSLLHYTTNSGATWSNIDLGTLTATYGDSDYRGMNAPFPGYAGYTMYIFDNDSKLHVFWQSFKSNLGTEAPLALLHLTLTANELDTSSIPAPVVLGAPFYSSPRSPNPGSVYDYYLHTAVSDTHLLVLYGLGPDVVSLGEGHPTYFVINLQDNRSSQLNFIGGLGVDGIDPQGVETGRLMIAALGGNEFAFFHRYGDSPGSLDSYASTAMTVIDGGGDDMHFPFNVSALPGERFTDLSAPGPIDGLPGEEITLPGPRTTYGTVVDAVSPLPGPMFPPQPIYRFSAKIGADTLVLSTFGANGDTRTYSVVEHAPGDTVGPSDIEERSDFTESMANAKNPPETINIIAGDDQDVQSRPIRATSTSIFGKVGLVFCRDVYDQGSLTLKRSQLVMDVY